MRYWQLVRDYPLQIYMVASIFARANGIIEMQVETLPNWMELVPGVREKHGESLQPLIGVEVKLTALRFSANGQILVSCRDHKFVALHYLVDWSQWQASRFWRTEAPVDELIFSPDGDQIVSVFSDGSVSVFAVKDRRRLCNLDLHPAPVAAIKYSANRQVALATEAGRLEVWSTQTGRRFDGIPNVGYRFALSTFSSDGTLLAFTTRIEPKTLRFWNAALPTSVVKRQMETKITNVVFSSNTTRLAVGCDDGAIRVYHVDTLALMASFDDHSRLKALAFSPSSEELAAWVLTPRRCTKRRHYHNWTFWLRNIETGEFLQKSELDFLLLHAESLRLMQLGSRLVAMTWDSASLISFDARRGPSGGYSVLLNVSQITMSEDGSNLATTNWRDDWVGSEIRVWSTADWSFVDSSLLELPRHHSQPNEAPHGVAYLATDSRTFIVSDPKREPGSYFRVRRVLKDEKDVNSHWLQIVHGDEKENVLVIPPIAQPCAVFIPPKNTHDSALEPEGLSGSTEPEPADTDMASSAVASPVPTSICEDPAPHFF